MCVCACACACVCVCECVCVRMHMCTCAHDCMVVWVLTTDACIYMCVALGPDSKIFNQITLVSVLEKKHPTLCDYFAAPPILGLVQAS